MATGRTVFKHSRVYLDNHNTYGNLAQSFGPLLWEFEEFDATAPMTDNVKGFLPGLANVMLGTVNLVSMVTTDGAVSTHFAPTAPAIYPYASIVVIPIGIRAAPAEGDPCFMGRFHRKGLSYVDSGGLATSSIEFGGRYAVDPYNFNIPWGILAHEYSAETIANSATGIDQGGATALGGYMVWTAVSANGTATIKMQDAATNSDGSFADITGLTTGVVDWTTSIAYGIASTTATQAVRQYVRWQIVLGTATTISFVLGFARRYSAGQ